MQAPRVVATALRDACSAALVTALLMGTACSNRLGTTSGGWPTLDPEIMSMVGDKRLPPELMASILTSESARALRCEMSNALNGMLGDTTKSEAGPDTIAFMDESAAEYKSVCAALTHGSTETKAIYETLKRSGILPSELFSFGVFVRTGDGTQSPEPFEEITIGPFGTAQKCSEAEAVLRNELRPTRRCAMMTF
jgi:hypothetical protein